MNRHIEKFTCYCCGIESISATYRFIGYKTSTKTWSWFDEIERTYKINSKDIQQIEDIAVCEKCYLKFEQYRYIQIV